MPPMMQQQRYRPLTAFNAQQPPVAFNTATNAGAGRTTMNRRGEQQHPGYTPPPEGGGGTAGAGPNGSGTRAGPNAGGPASRPPSAVPPPTAPPTGTVPPPVPPPPAPPVGAPPPSFTNDLREELYAPGGDAALTAAQRNTSSAYNAISGAPSLTSQATAAGERYRSVLGTGQVQAAQMGNLPNRSEIAAQALQELERQSDQNLQARYRQVGQRAAALGRIGSGVTTSEMGDALVESNRALADARRGLARDVAEGDIGDRFRRVEYETGVNERNADRSFERSRSAIELGREEADANLNDQYSRLSAASNLEDRLFGQGQANRGEYRTERARQDSLARQSIEDRITQRNLDATDRREALSRALAIMQAGGRVPNLEALIG